MNSESVTEAEVPAVQRDNKTTGQQDNGTTRQQDNETMRQQHHERTELAAMDELGKGQRGMGKGRGARRGRRPHWPFEDLEIWQGACDLAVAFHRIADRLDSRRLYRYAEQLRAAGLSLSNNIAEGSGSTHKQEFVQFLNITRRSLFEDASMLLVFERLQLLKSVEVDELLWDCDALSRSRSL
jgi:four helix bundle protein